MIWTIILTQSQHHPPHAVFAQIPKANTAMARQLETQLQRQLLRHGIALEGGKDASHRSTMWKLEIPKSLWNRLLKRIVSTYPYLSNSFQRIEKLQEGECAEIVLIAENIPITTW